MSTLKVEELLLELRNEYAIVTHNLAQASRCSDKTAFFYLGKLIEFDTTQKMFSNPGVKQTEQYVSGAFG